MSNTYLLSSYLVDEVTAEDLQTLLQRMFKSPLTMVGYGRMDKWPNYRDVQQELAAPLHPTRGPGRLNSIFKRFV